MYLVYAIKDNEKQIANSFENFSIAELYVKQFAEYARTQGYKLSFSIEKAS